MTDPAVGDAGAPARTVGAVAADGLPLRVEVAGAGPVVVLVHGLTGSPWRDFGRQGTVDAVVAAGFTAVLPEVRGHGPGNASHDPGRYGGRSMALDVAAALDTVGASAAVVAGYSMGARVAAMAALTDERVVGVVLGGMGESLVNLAWTANPTQLRAWSAPSLHDLPEADTTARAMRRYVDGLGLDAAALAALQRTNRVVPPEELPALAAAVAVPVVVAQGDADGMNGSGRALAARIPDARFVTLRGDHEGALRDPAWARSICDVSAAAIAQGVLG